MATWATEKKSKIMANQIYIVYLEICIFLINSFSLLRKCTWEPMYLYQRAKLYFKIGWSVLRVNNSIQGEPSWRDLRTWCPASMSTTSMYGGREASSSRVCGVVAALVVDAGKITMVVAKTSLSPNTGKQEPLGSRTRPCLRRNQLLSWQNSFTGSDFKYNQKMRGSESTKKTPSRDLPKRANEKSSLWLIN
jgi:hypothetical protein